MEQPKVDRLLRIMRLLTANNHYTISDIAERLNTSSRTIYRYIDTFREAGFVVKKDGEIYRLDKNSPHFKEINNLLHFSEEEAFLLKKAIESIDETNIIKQNLKKKLYTVYNYKILAETIIKGSQAENVNKLAEAISNKKSVVLKQYSSAKSNVVRDRIVEPFAFTTNYIQIWAFEPETQLNKLFKTSRIGSVELKENWQFESKHEEGFIDIFRMSSLQQTPISIKLNVRATQLVMEEYPLSEKYLTKQNDTEWLLQTNVASFEGVGRFIMGLLDEVEILEPKGLKEFINNKMINLK